jgi:hypothetical protein
MMGTVVSQDVTARPEGPPGDLPSFQFVHERRGLLFCLWRKHPIDRAAHAETGQFGKTPAAFSAHAERRGDLFNRRIADC